MNRGRVLSSALIIAGLLVAAALLEQWFEAQDERRFAAAETYAELGGARIRYRLLGAGEAGAPVVFINGIAASLEQWDALQGQVATFAPALTYDRAGAGFSHSGAYRGIEQAEELAALLDALHLARPTVLIGYSSGSLIAQIFAARHPERVSALLLVEPRVPEVERRLGWQLPQRKLLRPMTRDTLSCLFGVRRLFDWLSGARGGTAVEQRVRAISERFWHWWSVDRETLQLPEIDREAIAVGAVPPIPLLIFANTPREGERWMRAYLGLLREMAGTSARGELRTVPQFVPHGSLLQNPSSLASLTAGIRELALE
jgi:pimeloyl-ACP methyl ester carboxylesterase